MPHVSTSRRSTRLSAILGVAGVAGAISLMGLMRQPGQSPPVPASPSTQPKSTGAPGSMDLVEAQVTDFDVTTTATGDIRASKQIDIRNTLDTETTIVEIVPEGSSVKKGDVLIKLNSENIQSRLDEEKLQLENAKAQVVEADQNFQIQVSENDSAIRAGTLKLQLAELELRQWTEGELASKRQDLSHALERAQKEEERLRDKLVKSRSLNSKGYYSLDQLKQDELSWDLAKNQRSKAELDKRVYEEFELPKTKKRKESDVDEARAELERVGRQNASRIASREAALNNARQSLSIREQKFNKFKLELDSTIVKAPSDGLVVYASSLDNARWGNDEGPLQVGSKVFPNANMMALPDTSEMVAVVRVHESLASRIRKGQSATIRVDAAGGERYTGTIESIGILAEQTSRWMDPNLREYTVRIAIDLPKAEDGIRPTHALKPSMRCEADVLLARVNQALTVPIQAVFNEGPMRYVHVQDGSRYARRPVLLGQRSDRFAEVRTGLKAGERVLVRKPEPAELINRPWSAAELASVGLKMSEQGQVVSDGSAASAARPRGGPPSSAKPNQVPPAQAGPAAGAAGAPESAGKLGAAPPAVASPAQPSATGPAVTPAAPATPAPATPSQSK